MDRINSANAVVVNGKRMFSDDVPVELRAKFLNGLQEELATVIESQGIQLNAEDTTQLAQALARMIAKQTGSGGSGNTVELLKDPGFSSIDNIVASSRYVGSVSPAPVAGTDFEIVSLDEAMPDAHPFPAGTLALRVKAKVSGLYTANFKNTESLSFKNWIKPASTPQGEVALYECWVCCEDKSDTLGAVAQFELLYHNDSGSVTSISQSSSLNQAGITTGQWHHLSGYEAGIANNNAVHGVEVTFTVRLMSATNDLYATILFALPSVHFESKSLLELLERAPNYPVRGFYEFMSGDEAPEFVLAQEHIGCMIKAGNGAQSTIYLPYMDEATWPLYSAFTIANSGIDLTLVSQASGDSYTVLSGSTVRVIRTENYYAWIDGPNGKDLNLIGV